MNTVVNILAQDFRPVNELVVISGKGGTGKTSIAASFAALARNTVLADCDVDAADMHLLTAPRVVRRESFSGGKRARINSNLCTTCGQCEELCRFDAIHLKGPEDNACAATFKVDPMACEGCGVCAWFCPSQAIDLNTVVNGEWFVSETRFGPMVHARLGVVLPAWSPDQVGVLTTWIACASRRSSLNGENKVRLFRRKDLRTPRARRSPDDSTFSACETN